MNTTVEFELKNSTRFRNSAARESRKVRKAKSRDELTEHATRAASYKALAQNDEWLRGAKQRSGARTTKQEAVADLVLDTIEKITELERRLIEAKALLVESVQLLERTNRADKTRASENERSTFDK